MEKSLEDEPTGSNLLEIEEQCSNVLEQMIDNVDGDITSPPGNCDKKSVEQEPNQMIDSVAEDVTSPPGNCDEKSVEQEPNTVSTVGDDGVKDFNEEDVQQNFQSCGQPVYLMTASTIAEGGVNCLNQGAAEQNFQMLGQPDYSMEALPISKDNGLHKGAMNQNFPDGAQNFFPGNSDSDSDGNLSLPPVENIIRSNNGPSGSNSSGGNTRRRSNVSKNPHSLPYYQNDEISTQKFKKRIYDMKKNLETRIHHKLDKTSDQFSRINSSNNGQERIPAVPVDLVKKIVSRISSPEDLVKVAGVVQASGPGGYSGELEVVENTAQGVQYGSAISSNPPAYITRPYPSSSSNPRPFQSLHRVAPSNSNTHRPREELTYSLLSQMEEKKEKRFLENKKMTEVYENEQCYDDEEEGSSAEDEESHDDQEESHDDEKELDADEAGSDADEEVSTDEESADEEEELYEDEEINSSVQEDYEEKGNLDVQNSAGHTAFHPQIVSAYSVGMFVESASGANYERQSYGPEFIPSSSSLQTQISASQTFAAEDSQTMSIMLSGKFSNAENATQIPSENLSMEEDEDIMIIEQVNTSNPDEVLEDKTSKRKRNMNSPSAASKKTRSELVPLNWPGNSPMNSVQVTNPGYSPAAPPNLLVPMKPAQVNGENDTSSPSLSNKEANGKWDLATEEQENITPSYKYDNPNYSPVGSLSNRSSDDIEDFVPKSKGRKRKPLSDSEDENDKSAIIENSNGSPLNFGIAGKEKDMISDSELDDGEKYFKGGVNLNSSEEVYSNNEEDNEDLQKDIQDGDASENELEENQGEKVNDFIDAEAKLESGEEASDDENVCEEFDEDLQKMIVPDVPTDREKEKEKLAKIHQIIMQKKYDEDINLIKEQYIEDGDLHGPGRLKKYSYKNTTAEEGNLVGDDSGSEGDEEDGEVILQDKLEWKSKLASQAKQDIESSDEESQPKPKQMKINIVGKSFSTAPVFIGSSSKSGKSGPVRRSGSFIAANQSIKIKSTKQEDIEKSSDDSKKKGSFFTK